MYKNKKICVVIPAHNEQLLIQKTVMTIPNFVDRIIVVDDLSLDKTVEKVEELLADGNKSDSIKLICHKKNRGVGGAIVTGYKYARDEEYDIAVVMAGDNQMDPDDLPAILDPLADGKADYSKGNRLFTGQAWQKIPKVRYIGNSFLSLFTKVASGYWHVADSQTGYTAINLKMLKLIDWDHTYKRYGCPNDYLVKLNVYGAKVCDVPINPVYDVGEKSGIRLRKVIPRMSWLLVKLFFWRMKEKYIIRDFHPLVLFYFFGISLLALSIPLGLRVFWMWFVTGSIPPINALAWFFSIITGLQTSLFAMWFDMENCKKLSLEDQK